MKRFFRMMMILVAVTFNCVMGGTLAASVGVTPAVGALAMNGIATICGNCIPAGTLGAGLYTEAWTGFMVKAMRNAAESLGWYNKIKSFDQYAENDVIHLVHIGVDPTVLINNSTYPLEIESLSDADKAINLDKYQTKPTSITDDEVRALSYDKMSSVIERHREAIDAAKYSKAIHAIAPNGNTTNTPVLLTTGSNDAGGTHKKFTRLDIIAMKKKFDAMKVPVAGRVLVLCNDHVNDLLESDQKFADQYYNYQTGKISNMYSFEIYEFEDCPYYTAATKVKVAYGASVTGKQQASVAFYAPRMMKANGTTKTYLSEAKNDPQNQQNLINFRTYSICLPMKEECIGAIVSDAPAVAPTPPVSIIASTDALDFVAAGEALIVEVECPNNYIATITGTGFSKVKSGETVTVTAAANTGTERTGTLTLKDLVTGDTLTITLTQAGA
ncbi:MAG: BACON domain-containing protein [Bacteroidales bacterium]|nr:BACON domain-containing protein [Bacteroidales bacterium]